MAGFDELKDKATAFASEHADQIAEGVDKAGDFVDEKTDGKFADKVDGVQDAAKNFLNGLGK